MRCLLVAWEQCGPKGSGLSRDSQTASPALQGRRRRGWKQTGEASQGCPRPALVTVLTRSLPLCDIGQFSHMTLGLSTQKGE